MSSALAGVRDLLNASNGYLNDDGQIVITCTISAFLPSTCDAADGLRGVKRRCTDVKVVIGDRHVYVNRGLLAVNCEYFDGLFFGGFDDAQKEEIALDDVDFEDFTKFLEIVLPPHKAVCAVNIAAVMPLADRFGAKIILEQCEQFLVDEMDLSKAIPILEKCSLDQLKKQLLEIATKEDLDELTADDEAISHLSKETMSFILKEYKRRLSLLI